MVSLQDNELSAILQTISGTPEDEGKFFSDTRFFPGITYLQDNGVKTVYQPHVSLNVYEEMLAHIKRVDPAKYGRMHKGTPFYFIGWLSYEMKDYEKGVFYMDAALSEDKTNLSSTWHTFPAAAFIFLDDTNLEAAAREITLQMKHEVKAHLDRFLRQSGITLELSSIIDKFIRPNTLDPSYRSIMTSLLTFLLEGNDRQMQLKLRGNYGGTLEPFITHLFKGGLIFESLLKKQYSSSTRNQLGSYLTAAKSDLKLTKEVYKNGQPYAFDKLPSHLTNWATEGFHERAIAIAYAVRNTTGHDLGWQDILSDDLYTDLFEGLVNAIFWTIKGAYVI